MSVGDWGCLCVCVLFVCVFCVCICVSVCMPTCVFWNVIKFAMMDSFWVLQVKLGTWRYVWMFVCIFVFVIDVCVYVSVCHEFYEHIMGFCIEYVYVCF